MANAFVQLCGGTKSGGATCVVTNGSTATTAGNLLVAVICIANNVDVNSVTDTASNTYTKACAYNTDSYWTAEIWYCFNANAVAATTGTFTGSSTSGFDFGMRILEYSGLGAGSVSTTGKGTAASADPWATKSTDGSAAAGDLVVAMASKSGGTSFAEAAYNIRAADGGATDPSLACGDILSASSGTQSVTWNPSATVAGTWAIACFTPAGAATLRRYTLTTIGVG